MVVKDKKKSNIAMDIFAHFDCGKSSFKEYDFCAIFCGSVDCFVWNLQLGETWRKDITVFRKTFYEYVADAYAVLYDIYTDTCILFEKCVCDYVDTCDAVTGSFICGGLGIWRRDEIS